MSKQRIAAIIGVVLAVAGIVLIGVCIFIPGSSRTLMNLGLVCTALAFTISTVLNMKRKADREKKAQESES